MSDYLLLRPTSDAYTMELNNSSQIAQLKTDVEFSSDCRRKQQRRKKTTNPLSLSSWRGQRYQGRRKIDFTYPYVDRYHPSLMALCIALLLLNCADAFLTLQLMQHGAVEMNPVMRFFMQWNDSAFVIAKLSLSSLSIILLVAHYHFRWISIIRVSHVLYVFIAGYLMLFFYELYLLFAYS